MAQGPHILGSAGMTQDMFFKQTSRSEELFAGQNILRNMLQSLNMCVIIHIAC